METPITIVAVCLVLMLLCIWGVIALLRKNGMPQGQQWFPIIAMAILAVVCGYHLFINL